MMQLDPFLWQRLLMLAQDRERLRRPIVSSELPELCGIPSSEAVKYLNALADLGWEEMDPKDILIAVR